MVGSLGQLDRALMGIHELQPEGIVGIEKRFDSFRGARRAFRKPKHRLVGWLQTVVGKGQNGCKKLLLIGIVDLYDVPVRWRV